MSSPALGGTVECNECLCFDFLMLLTLVVVVVVAVVVFEVDFSLPDISCPLLNFMSSR